MPDALDDWGLEVPDEAWEDWLGPESPQPPEALPAGLLPRDRGDGAGFAAGGVAERLVPDLALAGFARDAWANGLDWLSDDELIGLLRAWRRLNSWAAAGELAVVTELTNRRLAQVAAGADPHLAEHVGDELAASLTLTARGADALLDFACALARLPLTRAALAAGQIDRTKAVVIADGVSGLDDEHAATVESAVIGLASSRTTGQLRAATQRAVLSADPSAARKRRERARKQARVEVWDEQFGTSALAGRDLPPADVLAADKRIDALARHLKATGLDGSLDQLRARVYTALLLGQPVESLEPPPDKPVPAGSARAEPATVEPVPGDARCWDLRHSESRETHFGQRERSPDGATHSGRAGQNGQVGAALGKDGPLITGSVNLTMPLTTWLGTAEAPGDAAGFGPIPADDARALADLIASQPGTRWCLTLTDRNGRPIGHGCARAGPNRRRPGRSKADRGSDGQDEAWREEAGRDNDARDRASQDGGARDRASPHGGARDRAGRDPTGRDTAGRDDGWSLTVTVRSMAVGDCSHERETAGYRPSPSLQHIINVRGRTCSFPGCRRPAAQCDQDHTIPYDQGGRTCECNLACLCRRHHRAKQTECWQLDQPEPGVLIWRLPHGRTYRVEPDRYP